MQEQLAITKEEENEFGKLNKAEQDRLLRIAAKIHKHRSQKRRGPRKTIADNGSSVGLKSCNGKSPMR